MAQLETERSEPQRRGMKILSWNVAGVRARLKDKYMVFLERGEYDVVCLQETKAEEKQVKMPPALAAMYPHRQWNATKGTTQRKGLSGTTIWSKQPVLRWMPTPAFDEEGRITAAEFDKCIVATVYTPNSQESAVRATRLPGAHMGRSVHGIHRASGEDKAGCAMRRPERGSSGRGRLPPRQGTEQDGGIHRQRKRELPDATKTQDLKDAFRMFNQEPEQFTFWDQKIPVYREKNRGWRIDYFLVSNALRGKIQRDKLRHTGTDIRLRPLPCDPRARGGRAVMTLAARQRRHDQDRKLMTRSFFLDIGTSQWQLYKMRGLAEERARKFCRGTWRVFARASK